MKMQRNKISISLILRTDKKRKAGDCPIYFLVLYNGKQIKIPTGKYTLITNWDSKKKKVKSNLLLNQNLNKSISDFNSFK